MAITKCPADEYNQETQVHMAKKGREWTIHV